MIEATGKHLTIKELFDEMKTLYARLIKLAEVYNKPLSSIKAVTYKDVLVKGGKRDDMTLNKIIKKSEAKDEYDVVKASYEDYREQAISRLKEMISAKPVDECIVYLRDELHWSWKEICNLFHYGRSQASKKYSDFKKRTTSDTIGH